MKQLLEHIEFEQLVRRAGGGLSEIERRKTTAHLSVCADCAAQLRKLENFFAYSMQENFAPVPQATTARLLNVYQPKKPKKNHARASFGQRVLGTLIFDDWLPEFVLHERLAFSDTRQFLYHASDYDVDLRVNFSGGGCRVTGQIFPDCASGQIEISSNKISEKVFLNQYCEFVFPVLEEGVYNLRIELENITIQISDVSLVT